MRRGETGEIPRGIHKVSIVSVRAEPRRRMTGRTRRARLVPVERVARPVELDVVRAE
jgi:hypothetical protein